MSEGNPLNAFIDQCSFQDGHILLKGWVLHKTEPLSHVSIFIDSTCWVEDLPVKKDRPDVKRHYPHLRHASRCSVDVVAPASGIDLQDAESVITIVGKRRGKVMGAIDVLFVDPNVEERHPPLPPEKLRKRVHGEPATAAHFLVVGRRCHAELKYHVEQYRSLEDFDRILDWGCGCGRVWRHLEKGIDASRLFGCDIDAEAIDWMSKAFPHSSFTRIEHRPPTPYASGYFDLILGLSIFTHLDEASQFAWLSELQRITRRDGIVAVSVHGDSAWPPGSRRRRSAESFLSLESPQSGEFAPYSHDDYYRSTYHSRAYVESRWSEYFEILDYVEQAIVWHQDLVILRKL